MGNVRGNEHLAGGTSVLSGDGWRNRVSTRRKIGGRGLNDGGMWWKHGDTYWNGGDTWWKMVVNWHLIGGKWLPNGGNYDVFGH